MAERKFNHLANKADLTAQSADILVRDLRGVRIVIDRAFLEFDLRASGHKNHA